MTARLTSGIVSWAVSLQKLASIVLGQAEDLSATNGEMRN